MKDVKFNNDSLKTNVNNLVEIGETPVKNTVGGKPSISFDTDLQSFLYSDEDKRNEDFETINNLIG